MNFIIEELKNPVRDLPRAIAISCSLCLIIYVFTIVAFHTILDKYEVLGSEAVAVSFANRIYGIFNMRGKYQTGKVHKCVLEIQKTYLAKDLCNMGRTSDPIG